MDVGGPLGLRGAVVVFSHAQAVGGPLVGEGLEQLEVAIFVHLGFLHGTGDAVWPLGAGEALGAVGAVAAVGLTRTTLAARTAGTAGAAGAAGTAGDLEVGGIEAARDLVIDKDDGDVAAGAANPAATAGLAAAAGAAGAAGLKGEGGGAAGFALGARSALGTLIAFGAGGGDGEAGDCAAGDRHLGARGTGDEAVQHEGALGAVKVVGQDHQVAAVEAEGAVDDELTGGQQDLRA